jgi:NitT/TauT family transport system permease protein
MSDTKPLGAASVKPAIAPRKKKQFDLRENPQYALVPAVFVIAMLAWEFLAGPLGIDEFVLPRPTQIWEALTVQLGDSQFWHHAWVTLQEAGLGFLIGVAVATVLGVLVARSAIVEKTVMPYVVAFQAVPKVALAPLFVVWFGFGLSSKIVMAAVIAFFPMLVNVIEGLKAVDHDKVEMLTTFGASESQIFRMARLPAALPFIFAGLDVGAVFAVLGAVVGEFIGAKEGLGYLLLNANYNFDIPTMFAVLVVLSAMGLLAHLLIRLLQRKLTFWAEDPRVTTA